MNHPDIPPKCEYFQPYDLDDKQFWFAISDVGVRVLVNEMALNRFCEMRKIIAAVAEVYWRKEADNKHQPNSTEWWEGMCKADDWRKWGEA